MKLIRNIVRKVMGADIRSLLSEYLNKPPEEESSVGYVGKVIDNNDPDKIGRCKIRVYGVYSNSISDKDLPWAMPMFQFVGSKAGSFVVPPIGAIVSIDFEMGDIYRPIYFSKVIDQNNLPSERLNNYPDNLILWKMDKGTIAQIDRSKEEVSIVHKTGTRIVIESNGNVIIENANHIDIKGETSTAVGGSFPLVYCLVPGLTAITDVKQLGVCTNSTGS